MRRHHTGSGRRGVIPADWQTHHGVVSDQATVDVACTVTVGPADGGVPAYDPGAGYSVSTATPVYTGPAAVMGVSITRERLLTVAEDEVATMLYQVKLLGDAAGVTVDHVVKVVTSDDPALTGAVLSIGSIERGTRRFSRVLLATLKD